MSDNSAAVIERQPGALRRFLEAASWICLGVAAAAALTVFVSRWGVDAASLGQYNMGLAAFFSFAGAAALIVTLYAVPVLVLAALASVFVQRLAALRFLTAGAVAALPFAVLSWLAR